MTTSRKYWLAQALAWGGYSTLSIAIAAQYTGWQSSLVIGYVLYTLYSIALTDLFRRLMHGRGWLDLPGKLRVLRIIPGILLGWSGTNLPGGSRQFGAGFSRRFLAPNSVLWLWVGTTMATWT